MASFVSSLRRSLSISRDSDTAKSPASSGCASMPNSPSFSDFSLGAEMEAEHELWRKRSNKKLATQSAKPQPSDESTWKAMLGTSSPRAIPQTQPNSNPSEVAKSYNGRRRPEGKINGMSYYDYHDLIRSASL